MGTRGLLVCITLFLVLGSVYSITTLNNTNDLSGKDFGKQFPRHGLKLLLWLICQGTIDQNGILQLNFNPANDVFGSHEFENKEVVFPDLTNLDKIYYTLGNIGNNSVREQFPKYVVEDFCRSPKKNKERNQDRVVIRVEKKNPQRVDEVYITQHYDSENTEKIGEELLRAIEKFCFDFSTQKLLDFLRVVGYVPEEKGNQNLKSKNQKSKNGNPSDSVDPECDSKRIQGYEVNLQLYAKSSQSCVRLYITKSFTDWKQSLYNAWVGLYASTEVQNSKYEKYAWITDFKKSDEHNLEDFDVYEYEFDLTIAPGFQARFMADRSYTSERARTDPWDDLQPGSTWGFWFSMFLGFFVVFIIVQLCNGSERPTHTPHFVAVSEGRPGL